MFGIGGTEWVVIGIVLLIAVGPNRLPKLIKAVVRTYRELRRATRELRASSGIDEIMRDEDLRELRKPLHVPPPKRKAPAPKAPAKRALTFTERMREDPPEGVDLAEIREREEVPSEEDQAAIVAQKEAKLAEERRVVAAKEAAARDAEPLDPEEHARRVAAKEAAAREPAASAAEPAATEPLGADER